MLTKAVKVEEPVIASKAKAKSKVIPIFIISINPLEIRDSDRS